MALDASPTSPDDVQARSFQELEWPVLLDRVAQRCTSEEGAAQVRQLLPEPSLERARLSMQRTAEAIAVAEAADPIPAAHVPALGDVLDRVRAGGVVSAPELRDVRLTLGQARRLRSFAARHRETYPALASAIESDQALDPLLEVLTRSIEDDGTVSDAASPDLRQARQHQASARNELLRKLTQLLRRHADLLRDQYYAEREGRYVLPVRADAHARVPGIVLGSSASGGTLYVEPHEATEFGNRLKVAEAAVEREEARVLTELSAQLGNVAEAVEAAHAACIEADILAALARWARDTRSIAVMPTTEARFELKAFRHPLLAESQNVVANDLAVTAGRALVISGPNAGGKTVNLKCLGLAAWMVRAGLPLPVAPESVAGWFEPVLSDVGDDQSILHSLSTFSAHIVKLCRILAAAGPHALVLLDEVAAGTDPEEGSALATAIVEALVQRGAAVVLTTHFERLKELATHDERFQNASVALDPVTFEPTFRLTLGVPGPSSALRVAERFGMAADVIERARALVPTQSVARETLVEQLLAEQKALETARRQAEQDAARHAALLREIEEERAAVREREREKLAREGRDLMAAVRQARAELRDVSVRVRQGELSREELRAAERTVDGAARLVALDSELAKLQLRAPAEGPAPANPEQLAVGRRVALPHLGTEGEIVEAPHRGMVRVLVGGLKLAVPIEKVTLAASQKQPARGGSKGAKSSRRKEGTLTFVEAPAPVRTAATTLDLRGARVDEALERVDGFIDELLRRRERAGFVLHGHGTGALKSAVREHLAASRHVDRSRPAEPDEGGDAFTVFWID